MERKVLVAKLDEVPIGRTKVFRLGPHAAIAYNDNGTLKAYMNRCTHMGGPVELRPAKGGAEVFRCRWHQAEFSPCTGEAIEGEAPQGTRLAPIELLQEQDAYYAVFKTGNDEFDF
jgi:nitrite reductase/ring-hydroxylating ferredoxin subunit